MSTYINVARYHLVQRVIYVVLPWGVLTFSFLVNLVGHSQTSNEPNPNYTGGLATIYVFLFVGGLLSVARSLPFGLSLGVSRRSYYLGTVLLAGALAAVYGLALAVLQAIERATGGWGIALGFFRVQHILDGPWYLTWLTSFVGLTLLFVYGMWFGLVYRRWNLVGLLAFIAAQIIVALAAVLVAASTHAWHSIGHFFTALTATGLTRLLAALAAVLLAGGLATIRRVTV